MLVKDLTLSSLKQVTTCELSTRKTNHGRQERIISDNKLILDYMKLLLYLRTASYVVGLRNPVKGRLLTHTSEEASMFMWKVRPEKHRSAVGKRPIWSQSSLLSWWPGQMNAAVRSYWLSVELCEALSWAGLNALRGIIGNGRDFWGCKAHLTPYRVFQLPSVPCQILQRSSLCSLKTVCDTLRFHLSVQFSIRDHFKNCTTAVLAGLQSGRKGACEAPWVWNILTSLWQPRFSLACMFMCKKYTVSECEQPRTPDTENGAPKCELKIVIIMMDSSVRSNWGDWVGLNKARAGILSEGSIASASGNLKFLCTSVTTFLSLWVSYSERPRWWGVERCPHLLLIFWGGFQEEGTLKTLQCNQEISELRTAFKKYLFCLLFVSFLGLHVFRACWW